MILITQKKYFYIEYKKVKRYNGHNRSAYNTQ